MSEYDYSRVSDDVKQLLPPGFQGNVYRLSYTWSIIIPVTYEPTCILEIGSYQGANVCSLMKTYAQHPTSEVHCIDPWFDYQEYAEYCQEQPTNYSLFLQNVSKLAPKDVQKLYIHRGLSEDIIPRFEDKKFDIIFIDGNHTHKYTLEDAVLSFKKLKPSGWMIFDDIQCKEVKEAADCFLTMYMTYFDVKILSNDQLFLQRYDASKPTDKFLASSQMSQSEPVALATSEEKQASSENSSTVPSSPPNVVVCSAQRGWCKNTCADGKLICNECTKMMDSYP